MGEGVPGGGGLSPPTLRDLHDLSSQVRAKSGPVSPRLSGVRCGVARENRRRYVNAFLVIWIAVLAIDAFRPINAAHRWLEDRVIDYPLDITGLWQGPWSLFRDVPRDNLRLSARIEFADGAIATWDSPDWASIAAPGK